MRAISPGGLPGFWEMLRAANSSFLALDYDGTLAPFTVERMEARVLPGTIELITKIRDRTGGAVAVVSGRPVSEVLDLLGDLGIMLVGSHGHEFRYPNRSLVRRQPTPSQSEGLEKAREVCVGRGLDMCMERKVASIALHTRGLPHEEAHRIEDDVAAVWGRIAPTHGLDLRRFNGGIELRCAGMDKGDALRTLLSLLPGHTFCVYIGDDDTDEDAFRAIRGRGFGIRVGDPGGPTHAQGSLPDIPSVQEFLRGWLRHAPEGSRKEVAWNHAD
jgi:trehalose-phosphatase